MEKKSMGRRDFLVGAAAVAVGAGILGATSRACAQQTEFEALPIAVQLGMLPKELPDPEKFALAKKCGYRGVEAYPMDDLEAARVLGEQSRDAGVPIHSIVFGGWHAPLSSPDEAVVAEGLKGMENALHSAKALGADTVLLVPAVVNDGVRYVDAYERSQANIRKLLPLAEETGIVIAVENVWNKFLLSPIEFARYVDEFESPWLKAYFDVGNNIQYGYAEDWVLTLGPRIQKIHLKDFRRKGNEWVMLGEGDVNWAATRAALETVGYKGFATCELGGGDEAYLTDVADRMTKGMKGIL